MKPVPYHRIPKENQTWIPVGVVHASTPIELVNLMAGAGDFEATCILARIARLAARVQDQATLWNHHAGGVCVCKTALPKDAYPQNVEGEAAPKKRNGK
jgi:hypothetical protein